MVMLSTTLYRLYDLTVERKWTGNNTFFQNSLEVKAVNPMIHLSKETLGDFEPDSLVYEPTEHQWEKKLKNRITNGSVSPLAVMDRMLKAIPRVFLALNEKDILHDEGEMLFNKLNAIRLVFIEAFNAPI